jgi:hypothetical protein
MNFKLHDPGVYPEPAICSKLTWRILKPWTVTTETEAKVLKSIQDSAKPRELSDEELLSLLRPPPHDSETSKKDGEKRI